MINLEMEVPGICKQFINKNDNEKSTKIYEVLGENELTVDRNYTATYRYMKFHGTLFKEIEILPCEEAINDIWKNLLKIETKTRKIGYNDFIDGFISTFSNYVERTWDSSKYNVVLHSSGFDSRIFSGILRKIYERRGDSWLGNLVFACFGSECSQLSEIMKVEGWKKNKYISLSITDDAFFRDVFNYDKAWLYLNGVCAYPWNAPFWVIEKLISLNKIPSDYSKIILWSAGYFNEVLGHMYKQAHSIIHSFLNLYYYCSYTDFYSACPFTFIQPILNYDTIKHIAENIWEPDGNTRLSILKSINPNLLKIRKMSNPKSFIPNKYLVRMVKEYNNSWYGKNLRPNESKSAPNKITYSGWWSLWLASSFTEHLLKKGYKIDYR